MQLHKDSDPATSAASLTDTGDDFRTAMPKARGLLVSEDAASWQPALLPLARHGIQLDVFDSAIPALAAVASAGTAPPPYRVIMLGRQVQGMDATVLASAIKANPAYRETLFVLLDDTNTASSSRQVHDGFAASLCRAAQPTSIESSLVPLFSGAAQQSSTPGSAGKDNVSPLPFSGCDVLVADDNPVNRQVAARMLEKLGCAYALADNGEQAVEMHAANPFDLVLMDCEMPVLDGLQATMRIRESEAPGRRTPIVALTAAAGRDEQEQCIAAGMDDFLSKPIRPQTLHDLLVRWLPQRAVAATAPLAATCKDELESVREMFGADFGELAALYQNDGPPRLAAIREAFAAGDCARVAKVTHALAGSSASIGATGLSALCKEVETAAKAGSLDAFEQRMTAIETEYARICSKLQSLLKP
jgi:CheY-like chemotaxis protein